MEFCWELKSKYSLSGVSKQKLLISATDYWWRQSQKHTILWFLHPPFWGRRWRRFPSKLKTTFLPKNPLINLKKSHCEKISNCVRKRFFKSFECQIYLDNLNFRAKKYRINNNWKCWILIIFGVKIPILIEINIS